MGDNGFNDGGWYPHDGEGKINHCPGPGCDCGERNYGHHSSSSNGNVSTFGAILCTIGGLVGVAVPFTIFGIDTENMSGVVIAILWIVISAVLGVIASNHGL